MKLQATHHVLALIPGFRLMYRSVDRLSGEVGRFTARKCIPHARDFSNVPSSSNCSFSVHDKAPLLKILLSTMIDKGRILADSKESYE